MLTAGLSEHDFRECPHLCKYSMCASEPRVQGMMVRLLSFEHPKVSCHRLSRYYLLYRQVCPWGKKYGAVKRMLAVSVYSGQWCIEADLDFYKSESQNFICQKYLIKNKWVFFLWYLLQFLVKVFPV